MQEDISKWIEKGSNHNPHRVLGLQKIDEKKKVIRLWRPDVEKCELEVCGKSVEATLMHDAGFFEYEVSSVIQPTDYKILHQNGKLAHDPYAFDKVFGELDVHLISRGLHYELYDFMGATIKIHQGVIGTHFGVWAPNAISVALIGEFNHWDSRMNPMRCIETTGVWEIFVPGIGEGERYKFVIETKEKIKKIKTDPIGHFFEVRPKNSSIVFDINRFHWSDSHWMEERKKIKEGNVPINIYEIHLGSWQKEEGKMLNYRELADRLVSYCQKMHFTHVELMGVCEHPLDESWGYQATGYFAPTSRHGTPEDFQYFINYLHEHHIGVILDWVPGHFPIDDHSLACFDGTFLYEHIDPRQGYHPQWNTHIFNYGRWEVSNFLIASALFWLEKMHIDGLRVDAVASMIYLDYARKPGEWIPNRLGTNINLEAVEFIKHMNSIIHQKFPNILMIAEESSTFQGVTEKVEKGGLGFDLKWNLGWMNDTLEFFSKDFSKRQEHLSKLSFIREYAFIEKFHLVLSHDEVVHEKRSLLEKMPGDEDQKFAGVRLLLSFMICFPGKKLLFMGNEIGQRTEWNCKESIHWQILDDSKSASLQKMISQLNALYKENPAFFQRADRADSFEWIQQKENTIAYLRKADAQSLLCIHQFGPDPIKNYYLPIKNLIKFQEFFNTDREEWGGSGKIHPEPVKEKDGLILSLPPLSTLIFEIILAEK